MRSFRKLRAFAIGVSLTPLTRVDGFPVRRLLRPFRHFLGHWSFVGSSPLPTSHSPSHPSGSFPCSLCRTQAERCRWRVAGCPFRSLRLPSHPQGRPGLPVSPVQYVTDLPGPILLPSCTITISVDWLTSQTRYVRVRVPRRAMHASGDSPWHSSAKHHLLRACLPLMVPFRTMLLTP